MNTTNTASAKKVIGVGLFDINIQSTKTFLDIVTELKPAIKNKISTLAVDTPLTELGIDKIDQLELAAMMEEKFPVHMDVKISIDDAKWIEAKTLWDMYTQIVGKVVNTPAIEQLNKNTVVTGVTQTIASTEQTLDDLLGTIAEVKVNKTEKKKWKKSYDVDEDGNIIEADSGSDHIESIKKMLIETGQEEDFVVVPADDFTLQIDLDEPEDVELFLKRYGMIQKELPKLNLKAISYTRSKSLRWHVTIKLKEKIDVLERLLLQSILGSDQMRDFLGYVNIKKGHLNPILFLERKDEWEAQKKLTP